MIERVEGLGDAFEAEAFAEAEGAAEAGVDGEGVEACASVAVDDGARKDLRAARDAWRAGSHRSALNAVGSGSDVEGERRVVLQDSAEEKAIVDAAPCGCACFHGGVDGAVENDAVALVIVGAAAILGDVEVVDGRAEEELADIVDGLGPGVGDAIAPPA